MIDLTTMSHKHAALIATAILTLAAPAALIAAKDSTDIPRRPDGRPDLSGTYDIATLTPRARPAEYGDRLELTAEEAKALADHWNGNFGKDSLPSDPDREAPPKGGVSVYAPELTGAAGKVGGYNAFFLDKGNNAFQIDGKYRTSILTDPPDGQYPARSALGKRLQEERAYFRHENTGTAWWLEEGLETGPYDHPEQRPLAERCIFTGGASGPPIMPSLYNNLKTIVQTDDYVMINIEWMHDTRIIRIDGEHGPDTVTSLTGDSIGRWDGDTLVVETRSFTERPGVAKGFQVVERFRRTDEDTVVYSFKVDDPAFSEPYSGEYPWPRTDNRLYEYACHEGNYAMGNIMRGARLLEEETLAGIAKSQ
ncbi:MAG: hypothetical protein VYE73_13880 [Acidobacteriota bacterium]|nr:hypothetical protein [Acidobacteriota bacterium]